MTEKSQLERFQEQVAKQNKNIQDKIGQIDEANRQARAEKRIEIAHKLAIEKSMGMDPYTEKLFSEEKYDQLIWFENRRTNILLEQVITLLGGTPIVPTVEDIHEEVEQSPEDRKEEIKGLEEALGESEDLPGEFTETDPAANEEESVMEEGTPEEQSLSEQERVSTRRGRRR